MPGVKGRSGRRPIPTAILLAQGTYRPDRHASRIDAPGQPLGPKPSEISEEAQAKRRAELAEQLRRIKEGT